MKRKLILSILMLIVFAAGGSFFVPAVQAGADVRVHKLSKFLSRKNPELRYLSRTFVEEADKNGLDYRLVPAISGVESGFGKAYIRGTHNIYGWGGGRIYFDSWEEGISKVSFGLKKGYVDRGAKEVEQISWIYCPPGNLTWAAKVRFFMSQIDEISEDEAREFALSEAPKLTLTL